MRSPTALPRDCTRLSGRRGHASRGDRMPARSHREEPTAKDNIFLAATAERARQEASVPPRATGPGRRCRRSTACRSPGRTCSASQARAPRPARDCGGTSPEKTADIPVVANAAASGMVTLGKLNMTEFAYSGLGLNPHFGTPINPNDRATPRSPGGSSSGSGAAVAATAGARGGRFRHRRLGAHSRRL